jgi:hypothetical protein
MKERTISREEVLDIGLNQSHVSYLKITISGTICGREFGTASIEIH